MRSKLAVSGTIGEELMLTIPEKKQRALVYLSDQISGSIEHAQKMRVFTTRELSHGLVGIFIAVFHKLGLTDEQITDLMKVALDHINAAKQKQLN